MKHIVSFSGGKDSTAMLLMMIEKQMQIDKIVMVDTTKEFPAMYEHVKKVQKYIKPFKIDIIKIDFDYWFSEHIKTKGKNKGLKGYGFPDNINRWCTALKRQAIKKYERSLNDKIIQYHGIAIDEKHRTEKNGDNIKYPLCEWNITEQEALKYCYNKGFNWDNLYHQFDRVSCWCCPLSNLKELKNLYTNFPELWEELKKMEKKSYRKFKNNYTVKDLDTRFYKESLQQRIF